MSGQLERLLESATPGSWAWRDFGEDDEDENYPGSLYQADELARYEQDGRRRFPTTVLSAHGVHTDGYVVVAPSEARLIALAPDLARLLVDAMEALEAWVGDGSNHEPGCLIDPETQGGCDCFTSDAAALLARFFLLEQKAGEGQG